MPGPPTPPLSNLAQMRERLRDRWRAGTTELMPASIFTDMARHGWTPDDVDRLLSLAATVTGGQPEWRVLADLQVVLDRLATTAGRPPAQMFGWLVVGAHRGAPGPGWLDEMMDLVEVEVPDGSSPEPPPPLLAWLDAIPDQHDEGQLAALAWAAGLSPAEARAQFQIGALDVAALRALIGLRSRH